MKNRLPQPVIQYAGGGLYRVVEDYTVSYSLDGQEWTDTIRAGTLTDLASVPGVLLSLADNNGGIDGPAVWHDYAWKNHLHGYWKSNAVFWGLMARTDLPLWKRVKYWLGVTNPKAYMNWRKGLGKKENQ